MESEKLGTCWLNQCGHSGLHEKSDHCSEWREQPQGEATRGPTVADINRSGSNLTPRAAQTEGGEKPRSAEQFLAVEGFADSRAHSSTAIAELIERYVKYLQSFEPASPPAQPAGGAREFGATWGGSPTKTPFLFAEAYADQRVRQQEEAYAADIRAIGKRIDELTPQVAQLRQERDALKSDAFEVDLELTEAKEARERAEKALRRLLDAIAGDNDDELHLATREAVAALKSSEATK